MFENLYRSNLNYAFFKEFFMKKKILLMLAICVMLLALALTLAACDTDTDDSEATTTTTTTTTQAPKEFRVQFICPNNGGTVEGEAIQKIPEGETTAAVKAIPALGYSFVCWSNGELSPEITVSPTEDTVISAIFVTDTKELPIIQINTQNNAAISTKDFYVDCCVSVSNAHHKYNFSKEMGKIKLRGNSTAYLDKHPYKLKFEEKVDLFGNGEAKTWTLIANYLDCSQIRNYLAFSLGEALGLQYTTSFQFVELYLNGVYDGVYLVCEQIEVKKHRVDIEDSLDSAPKDTGYLIELDARAPSEGVEDKDFFYLEGLDIPYAIKSPDTEDEKFTSEHVEYIKGYMQACLAALDSDDYNKIIGLIDVESFAKSYIINELFNNNDVRGFSFYMYKNKDGKLFSGPIWDYDLSVGNTDDKNCANPETMWAGDVNPWYNKLLNYTDFRYLVCSTLENYKDDITDTINDCVEYVNSNENSFNRNFDRWDILGKDYGYPPDELDSIQTWGGHVSYVVDWLENSLSALTNEYPAPQ